MVTLGTDAHKTTHTFVAADDRGTQVGEATFAADSDGHLKALKWAGQWSERRWAVEDCRHLTRTLERDLISAGETVVRVPPKLMAGARNGARTTGKSDPIDALAVARAALREPGLPSATLDGPSRELRLLVAHREDLVAERTRIQNRLRWHLHELAPGTEPEARTLDLAKVLAGLDSQLAAHSGLVADLARELVARIRELNARICQLEREVAARTAWMAPSLLALPGCGSLTAAKILGEVAGVSRFRSRAAFAMHNGSAPIPVWSGRADRFRLNRGGNRQINVALHRIAVTQMRLNGPGKAYIAKRVAHGNTKTEAIRALRRRLSDEVYRRLWQDQKLTTACVGQAA